MKFTIDAYWIYGYRLDQLGRYQVEDKVSVFYINGKKYASPWLAVVEIRNLLYKAYDWKLNGLVADQIGGESIIGYKIEGEIDRLNHCPSAEVFEKADKELKIALEKIGFSADLPKAELYFLVECNNE